MLGSGLKRTEVIQQCWYAIRYAARPVKQLISLL